MNWIERANGFLRAQEDARLPEVTRLREEDEKKKREAAYCLELLEKLGVERKLADIRSQVWGVRKQETGNGKVVTSTIEDARNSSSAHNRDLSFLYREEFGRLFTHSGAISRLESWTDGWRPGGPGWEGNPEEKPFWCKDRKILTVVIVEVEEQQLLRLFVAGSYAFLRQAEIALRTDLRTIEGTLERFLVEDCAARIASQEVPYVQLHSK